MTTAIIILIILIIGVIAYFVIKPYTIKYDTTLAFTGGLGAGKTLNAVKTARTLWKKADFKCRFHNKFMKFVNKVIINPRNVRALKYNNKHPNKKHKKVWETWKKQERPLLYSNIPILLNKRKGIYSTQLTKEHLMLQDRIREYSIVLIDELPQLVNQFNWNIKDVKNNVNEFITFFRHYIGGYFIVTAQSIDDIVCQIRRKLNTYYWLFDFHKLFFIFYRVRICSMMTSEAVQSTTTSFIEENTKWKYGCLLPKAYNSRCYKPRYEKVNDSHKRIVWNKLTTKKIIRFDKEYRSPLD